MAARKTSRRDSPCRPAGAQESEPAGRGPTEGAADGPVETGGKPTGGDLARAIDEGPGAVEALARRYPEHADAILDAADHVRSSLRRVEAVAERIFAPHRDVLVSVGKSLKSTADSLARLRGLYREMLYKETESPLHAWAEWRDSRRQGRTPPAWVLGYLDRAAERLLEHHGTPPAGGAMKALGLGGGHGQRDGFSKFKRGERWVDITVYMRKCMADGVSEDKAADSAAAHFSVSKRDARRAFERFDSLLP